MHSLIVTTDEPQDQTMSNFCSSSFELTNGSQLSPDLSKNVIYCNDCVSGVKCELAVI